MLLRTQTVITMPEFQAFPAATIQRKLAAIEAAIREHTHNNFQRRGFRWTTGTTSAGRLRRAAGMQLSLGDTVEISESAVNNGIYSVDVATAASYELSARLSPEKGFLVTLVEYPPDVIEGALGLLRWELTQRDKVGVKSETLSRHSVTYFDQDAANQINGYPVSLWGFCKPHMKARF